MTRDDDWQDRALCAYSHRPQLFDDAGTHHEAAALYCSRCPGTAQCLAYGLEATHDPSHAKLSGTYGGRWVVGGHIGLRKVGAA